MIALFGWLERFFVSAAVDFVCGEGGGVRASVCVYEEAQRSMWYDQKKKNENNDTNNL